MSRESGAANLGMACAVQFMQQAHSAVFPQLRESLSGKNIALLGSGPSLRQAPDIGGCLIATCNHSHTFVQDQGSDFYFAIDYQEASRSHIQEALRVLRDECRIFLGYYMEPRVSPAMMIPWHLHEDPRVSTFMAYPSIYPRMELEFFPVYQTMTIMHGALHIMLYTGPDVIYLLGCDCSPTGYFDNRNNPAQAAMPVEDLKYGYIRLRELQQTHRPATRIVSVNPVGLRGVFEDVYTPGFLALHPELRVSAAQVVERI